MLNSTEYKDAEILRLIGAEIASYEDRPQKKRFGKTWQDDMPEIQAWLESVGSSAETAVEQFRREGVVDLFVKHAAGVLDSKAYVNMTHFPVWEGVFDNAKRFRRWIDSVSEDIIRRKQEARRLKVHAGD